MVHLRVMDRPPGVLLHVLFLNVYVAPLSCDPEVLLQLEGPTHKPETLAFLSTHSEAPKTLLSTKEHSKNISSGKEFPFKNGLRALFWCLLLLSHC